MHEFNSLSQQKVVNFEKFGYDSSKFARLSCVPYQSDIEFKQVLEHYKFKFARRIDKNISLN